MQSVLLPVIVYSHSVSVVVSALIGSGAERKVQPFPQLRVPTKDLPTTLRVAALDGAHVGAISSKTQPLLIKSSALHSENLALFVIEQSEFEFILSLSWLENQPHYFLVRTRNSEMV